MTTLAFYRSLKVWSSKEIWIQVLIFWLNSSHRKHKAANHPTAGTESQKVLRPELKSGNVIERVFFIYFVGKSQKLYRFGFGQVSDLGCLSWLHFLQSTLTEDVRQEILSSVLGWRNQKSPKSTFPPGVIVTFRLAPCKTGNPQNPSWKQNKGANFTLKQSNTVPFAQRPRVWWTAPTGVGLEEGYTCWTGICSSPFVPTRVGCS